MPTIKRSVSYPPLDWEGWRARFEEKGHQMPTPWRTDKISKGVDLVLIRDWTLKAAAKEVGCTHQALSRAIRNDGISLRQWRKDVSADAGQDN